MVTDGIDMTSAIYCGSTNQTKIKLQKDKFYTFFFPFFSSEPSEMTHHLKLLTAKPHQVLDIIETEKKQLEKQLAECEPSEEPFIIAAQAQLKVRLLYHYDVTVIQWITSRHI